MQVNELPALRCARMLLLEHDFEEFPYSPGGSGFLIIYNACLFLVTASHCLKNNKADAQEVCILDGSDGQTFLVFDRVSRGKPENENDIDYADFAILRIKANTISGEQLRNLHPFPINARTIIRPDDPSIRFFVTRGFPKDLNPVDYENNRIPQRSLTMTAKYEMPDESQSHVHVMRYADAGKPISADTTGDGMSGSPVFAVSERAGYRVPFAGMILRGGHMSGLWRFASASVLWSALRGIERQGEVVPLSDDLLALLKGFLSNAS